MARWLAYRIGDDDTEERLILVHASAEAEAREIAQVQLASIGIANLWAEGGRAIREIGPDEEAAGWVDRRPVEVGNLLQMHSRLEGSRHSLEWLASRARACSQLGTLGELDAAFEAVGEALADLRNAINHYGPELVTAKLEAAA